MIQSGLLMIEAQWVGWKLGHGAWLARCQSTSRGSDMSNGEAKGAIEAGNSGEGWNLLKNK